MKVDLVKSGAAEAHANEGANPKAYDDLLCYMNAVYGKGREQSYFKAKTVVEIVGTIVVPKAVVEYGLVGGAVAGGVFSAAQLYLEFSERGTCSQGGAGLNSVIRSNVCQQIQRKQSSGKPLSSLNTQEKLNLLEAVSKTP